MVKCPYCKRNLTKHERWCYLCENDVGKTVDEEERPRLPEPRGYDLKKELADYKRVIKNIFNKRKKAEKEDISSFSAYCVKCKKKVAAKEPKETLMKNGMKALTGKCTICSSKVFKIVGKKN